MRSYTAFPGVTGHVFFVLIIYAVYFVIFLLNHIDNYCFFITINIVCCIQQKQYVTTADYISSGYTVTPGYYVDWNKSKVQFNLSASFGGVRGSLSEIYSNELGSAGSGYQVVKE